MLLLEKDEKLAWLYFTFTNVLLILHATTENMKEKGQSIYLIITRGYF
jgi:hypothetical protein